MHWSYGADPQYLRFAEAEWLKARHMARTRALRNFAYFAAGGLLAALIKGDVTFTEAILVASTIGLISGISTFSIIYWTAKSTYRKRLEGISDVYVGRDGMYHENAHTSWKGPFLTLKVSVETGDPYVLSFQITDSGTSTRVVRVAVPRGHEGEATELRERFEAAA